MSTVLETARPQKRSTRGEARSPVSERRTAAARQLYWLLGGAAFAFAVPFLLSDILGLQRAVFYEVLVRSFQDSDGDGVGDLERDEQREQEVDGEEHDAPAGTYCRLAPAVNRTIRERLGD